jgi:hypothetical protein
VLRDKSQFGLSAVVNEIVDWLENEFARRRKSHEKKNKKE